MEIGMSREDREATACETGCGALRLRLNVAYLGGRFAGWQVQRRPGGEGPRTVQGVLEEALGDLFGSPVRVHGAGRTDAGVHATGQVAQADLPPGVPVIPPYGVVQALNRRLAPDVRVTGAALASEGWHARFSATGKTYVYRLRRGSFLLPHAGLVEALARERLDVAAMREAGRLLVGRHDFAPFSVTGTQVSSSIRHLRVLGVEEEGPVVVVTAVADGFLRGMVRRLVGTLRDVGRGRIDPTEALARPGPTAEARGLTLVEVSYPTSAGEPVDGRRG